MEVLGRFVSMWYKNWTFLTIRARFLIYSRSQISNLKLICNLSTYLKLLPHIIILRSILWDEVEGGAIGWRKLVKITNVEDTYLVHRPKMARTRWREIKNMHFAWWAQKTKKEQNTLIFSFIYFFIFLKCVFLLISENTSPQKRK